MKYALVLFVMTAACGDKRQAAPTPTPTPAPVAPAPAPVAVAAPAVTAVPAGTIAVRGKVVDLQGAPIAGAQVTVQLAQSGREVGTNATGADGTFVVAAARGIVEVTVRASGFGAQWTELSAPGRIELVLAPGGTVTGRVMDPAGRPAVGAKVKAAGQTATTDDQGAYTLAGVRPGSHMMFAEGDGTGGAEVVVGVGETVTAPTLALKPTPPERPVVKPGEPFVRLSGSVRFTADRPAADAMVTLRCEIDGRGIYQALGQSVHTDAAGAYAFESLAPAGLGATGTCFLEVSGEHLYTLENEIHQLTLPLAGGAVTKDIVVKAGGIVTGTVKRSDGTPLAGVRVDATAVDVSDETSTSGTTFHTDADGAFAITNLAPGVYELAPEPTRLEATRPFREKATPTKVVVKAGTEATVALVYDGAKSVISGVVRDQSGAAIVNALVLGGRTRYERARTLTGADGSFTLTSLWDAQYDVRAYRPGGGAAFAAKVPAGTTDLSLIVKR